MGVVVEVDGVVEVVDVGDVIICILGVVVVAEFIVVVVGVDAVDENTPSVDCWFGVMGRNR